MTIIWITVRQEQAEVLLKQGATIVVWASALNGVLAVVSARQDLSAFLRHFWFSNVSLSADGVAGRAAELGRYSGVFNQPAEAGLMYGVGALVAVYCYRHRPGRLALLLAFIVLGGLICVSKIFIMIGLPLTLWYLWRSHRISAKVGLLLATPIIILATVLQSGYFANWIGFELPRTAPDQT